MIFKKKKNMKENTPENNEVINENTDNLAQQVADEEQISRELNTDDSISEAGNLVEEDSEIEKLQTELDEAKDKYVRLVAEFDNFRKRNAKERIELIQTAGQEVIKSLLTVLDDMDRAAKQIETAKDVEAVKEAVALVFNKMKTIMQQKGLQPMDAMNQPFDADLHEAITEIPAGNEDMIGKVMDVVEQGYYLNDKLIRHAKVVVGK
jgi:molecular chaperone GrpE